MNRADEKEVFQSYLSTLDMDYLKKRAEEEGTLAELVKMMEKEVPEEDRNDQDHGPR